MNLPLLIAGCLGVLAAAVHGIGGELLVVRKLDDQQLPPTRFGGTAMTKAMLHVSWHIATIALLAVGAELLAAALVLDGFTAEVIALIGAASMSAIAAVALGLGFGYMRTPRALLQHPGPAILTATAALAWWGVL